jgi:hypothetical protein
MTARYSDCCLESAGHHNPRRRGRAKAGLGLNAEHSITYAIRMFTRAGWNDGRNESFAYTEVDRTLQLGGDVKVPHRKADKAGIAAT